MDEIWLFKRMKLNKYIFYSAVLLTLIIATAVGYVTVQPKTLKDTQIASITANSPGAVKYTCPAQVKGLDQLDECIIEKECTGASPRQPLTSLTPGGFYGECFTYLTADKYRFCCIGEIVYSNTGVPIDCKGTMLTDTSIKWCELKYYSKEVTYHYTGNGICEVDLGENCQNAPQDCGSCPTPPPDTTLPSVSILSPSSGQSFTKAVTVSGTASDDVELSKVEVKVGSETWQLTTGTTSWSKLVTLSSGSNTIYVRATDTSGNTAEISAIITYTQPLGSVYVTSNPPGASIYLDGSYKGNTPLPISDIQSGSHTIRFSKSGYEDCIRTITVSENQETDVSCTLATLAPKLVILANSIDSSLASDFLSFLQNRDIEVVRATASNFAQYKNEKFILVLGGPDAYEGVGRIVREILNIQEGDFLRQRGNRKMYAKTNVWTQGQVVIVIAGSDRYQTQKAHVENRDGAVAKVGI